DGPAAAAAHRRGHLGAGRGGGALPRRPHVRPRRAALSGGRPAYDGAVPIEIDPTMHPQCAPLAWMIGSWAGAGVVGYPSIESRNFGQEVEVTHDGRPFLRWTSR